MASGKKPGIDIDSIQNVVDGTLCRSPSGQPGPLGVSEVFATPLVAVPSLPRLIYCHLWTDLDRKAFWLGFLGRIEEFGSELDAHFTWFVDAFGLGDSAGDFEKAWAALGAALGQLVELAYKMTVVAGIPPIMAWHPQRDAYTRELSGLGVAISQQLLDSYKKAYSAGGLPQCTGVLFADLLRVLFEILIAKGLAAGAKTLASGSLLKKAPAAVRKIPEKIKEPPTRHQLINYIRHDKSAALHGEGILTDLKPGEFLIRVEATAAKRAGNWFNGPFKTREEAVNYAKYLADLGRDGIRRESALPRVWKGGGEGNPIEVIRVYEVNRPTPAISSVVAPQRESGTVMVRQAHRDAMKSGNVVASAEYPGRGQQLSVPVSQTSKVHEIALVRRMSGAEIKVTKP